MASQRFLGSIMPKRSREAAAVNLVRIPPRQFDNAAVVNATRSRRTRR
jgi:hypothetical protein